MHCASRPRTSHNTTTHKRARASAHVGVQQRNRTFAKGHQATGKQYYSSDVTATDPTNTREREDERLRCDGCDATIHEGDFIVNRRPRFAASWLACLRGRWLPSAGSHGARAAEGATKSIVRVATDVGKGRVARDFP